MNYTIEIQIIIFCIKIAFLGVSPMSLASSTQSNLILDGQPPWPSTSPHDVFPQLHEVPLHQISSTCFLTLPHSPVDPLGKLT